LELPAIDDADRSVSKKEAVKLLSSAISQLQRRKYSMQQIAEFLTKGGLPISAPSLKSYLSMSRKRLGGKRHIEQKQLPRAPNVPVSKPAAEKSSSTTSISNPLANAPATAPARAGSFMPREDSSDI
jgi:IS30 family transposase